MDVKSGTHELVYFRREFNVSDSDGAKLVVDITADSRYRLFLNGESVTVGPCKGDQFSHYYETVDLSERLITGKNVLAVKVLHYAAAGPFEGCLVAIAQLVANYYIAGESFRSFF